MGSRGRMLFDLNELPAEADDEAAGVVPQEPAAVTQEAAVSVSQEAAIVVSQPQKSLPVPTTYAPSLFQPGEGSQSQGILNNNAFKHASIGSGFQPFVRSKDSNNTKESIKAEDNMNSSMACSSMVANHITDNAAPKTEPGNQVSHVVEREEGEWSDADVISENAGSSVSNKDESVGTASTHVKKECQDSEPHLIKSGDVTKDDTAAECSDAEMTDASKDQVLRGTTGLDSMPNLECKGNQPGDDLDACNRPKDVKGVEANYALKFASNPAKRPKLNEHKEAMLGKKRARQTVFINVEDAKQAGTMKTSTPRRQSSFPAPIVTRTVKEASRAAGEKAAEKQNQQAIRERQSEMMGSERSNSADPSDQHAESNGDAEIGPQGRSKKMNAEEPYSDGYQQPVQRQASLKQSMDLKQPKGRPFSSQRTAAGQNTADQKPASKRSIISKKQTFANNMQYQDSSVERLIREVTNDKFWHNPGCFFIIMFLLVVYDVCCFTWEI